jgi:ribonuclease HI
MAIGASIQDDLGAEIGTVSALIGKGTNNIAEYRAAIEGLKKAKDLGTAQVELRMDSELVIRHIQGAYKIKKDTLKPLYAEVMALLRSFDKYSVKHVPREDNARADELANLAYDQYTANKNVL